MRKLLAETDRLYIRNWMEKDIEPYAKIIGDPDVMRFIGDGTTKPYEESVRAYEKYNHQIDTQGWARFAVALKENDEVIGFCGYDFYLDDLDFGWRLAKHQWGKGYTTEAARAVLRLGIEEFKFNRIVCHAFEENKASINIMEKIGLSFERIWMFQGKPVKQYAITNDHS